MTPEQNSRIEKLIELILPEAKEFTDEMLSDPMKTTQNNYGKVMSTLSMFEKDRKGWGMLFLAAMVRSGYPQQTAEQIRNIMGWA